ncbi:hypothetical protein Bhyg_02202, partial [Pseudolycoriella hygida]
QFSAEDEELVSSTDSELEEARNELTSLVFGLTKPEDIPSPLQSAVPVTDKDAGEKQRYKNDDYLKNVMIICENNPEDDANSCIYVAASMMILITAHEPELTMERLAAECSQKKNKKLPEERVQYWESRALQGGGSRIFYYIISLILNHPVYALDLSTNRWREYDLSNANHEQAQFHSDLVREFMPLNYIGPFMVAEHMERTSDDKLIRTHVAPFMHNFFWYDFLYGSICDRLRDYVKLMSQPEVQSEYPFVFASDESSCKSTSTYELGV